MEFPVLTPEDKKEMKYMYQLHVDPARLVASNILVEFLPHMVEMDMRKYKTLPKGGNLLIFHKGKNAVVLASNRRVPEFARLFNEHLVERVNKVLPQAQVNNK